MVPLRELPEPRPEGSCASWPWCSVSSALRAASSTFLVTLVSNPSGPTSSPPCSLGGQELFGRESFELLRSSLAATKRSRTLRSGSYRVSDYPLSPQRRMGWDKNASMGISDEAANRREETNAADLARRQKEEALQKKLATQAVLGERLAKNFCEWATRNQLPCSFKRWRQRGWTVVDRHDSDGSRSLTHVSVIVTTKGELSLWNAGYEDFRSGVVDLVAKQDIHGHMGIEPHVGKLKPSAESDGLMSTHSLEQPLTPLRTLLGNGSPAVSESFQGFRTLDVGEPSCRDLGSAGRRVHDKEVGPLVTIFIG